MSNPAPSGPSTPVVLVHGWSVHNTSTYGELPARLEREAASLGMSLSLTDIQLSRYVSFKDEVRLEDISRAFQAAVQPLIKDGRRFVCITHSTGGPVVRDWWHRYYMKSGVNGPCPMSHLIMLAPANFGSALAQLGQGKLSRIKAWAEGIKPNVKGMEPGTGVLEWLELGSPESWDLNLDWIRLGTDVTAGANPVFPFVLTGQSIDRSMYDHVNSYTGEVGSDGVVRAAAANLNATYLRLEQEGMGGPGFKALPPVYAQRTAFKLVEGRSHSGKDKGILRSIRDDGKPHPTVTDILRCLAVRSRDDYVKLCAEFEGDNAATIAAERVEHDPDWLRPNHMIIHDRQSMLIFRVRDDQGRAIGEYKFILTGSGNNPDHLPQGFLTDRQRNRRDQGCVTYYLNYDVLEGSPPIPHPSGGGAPPLRAEVKGVEEFGFSIEPDQADDDLFVRYAKASRSAEPQQLEKVLRPNQTTLVDVVLDRIVGEGTLRLTKERKEEDFSGQPPGKPLPPFE